MCSSDLKASGRGLVEMVNSGIIGEDVDGMEREMQLNLALAAGSGAAVLFLLLQHNVDPAQWQRQLAVCEAAARDGHQLVPQVAGRPISILFSFEGEHPWRFMPSYAAIADLPFEQRYAALASPEMKARLLAEQDPKDRKSTRLNSSH